MSFKEVKERAGEIKIIVVTKPVKEVDDRGRHEKCIALLREGKVEDFEREVTFQGCDNRR